MPLLEAQGVGWSLAVHGGLLTKTLVNVHCTEEGHGHWEIPHVELVREHGSSEKVGILEGQCETVAIFTLHKVAHLERK